ncbi:E3 ubiquitin-protein ligase PUB24 [Ricinus communis]|uniref:U-box domain-containing protein n=1 Tax=Ricinus communis TaxID=3988 RepID=B9SDI6_RICCO|nr:E3 ubiquitin-protein ligase PUB24 [Ricinus communis]EEF38265.1 Spotted leaf protein, putative [Ricinus communis]|eukprot:XP_002524055.1 E3 ubiquitin-protein ligase PUB24 [Ricinus communis]
MDDIEIPQYFICPISLQIMKDPVTIITGITYDRDSIEQWLFTTKNTICPVTKQSLPKDFDLTPNHTLRRLIQAWCIDNASSGIDRIPTPKPCLDKFHLLKLIKDLHLPRLQMKTLVQLELLAAENDRNRKYMAETGVPKALLLFIVTCFKKGRFDGIQEAVSILRLIRIPPQESRALLSENDQIIESLTWVLRWCSSDNHITIKSHAVSVLKMVSEDASSSVLERLKPEFFETIVGVIREKITQQGINAALKVLSHACPWGRNRIMMVDAGAVFELIELEWRYPEKKTTELILGILFHLCSCADGRAKFLSHRGGIAVVAKRILKVSPAADDRAVLILSLICKFSGTSMVLQEMLNVKAVSKLCMMLQADCAVYLKDKAREILRLHSDEWKNSPCIDASFLTG